MDQVQEGEAATEVGLGDRHDEPQVRLDHLLLGEHVAALDAAREDHLLLGGEQAHPPDRAQVEPQRIERRLDGQVDLDLLTLVGLRLGRPGGARLDAAALRFGQAAVFADDFDALLVEERVELLHLLLGDVHLLQAGLDLRERQHAALGPFRDQRLELLELSDRCLIGKQHESVIAHVP